jgi:hypothetical protein
MKLTLKELLSITNDGASTLQKGGQDESPLSQDFQMKQIDRIVEAIALTLPPGMTGP